MTVLSKMAKSNMQQKGAFEKRKKIKGEKNRPGGICSICKDAAQVPYYKCMNCGKEPSDHHTGCCRERSKQAAETAARVMLPKENRKLLPANLSTHRKWMAEQAKWFLLPTEDRQLTIMGRCWSQAAHSCKQHSQDKIANMRCREEDEMVKAHQFITTRKGINARKAEWAKLREQNVWDTKIQTGFPARQTALSNSTPEDEVVAWRIEDNMLQKRSEGTKYKLTNAKWSKREQQMRTIVEIVIQNVMDAIDIRVEAEDTVWDIIHEVMDICEEAQELKRQKQEARKESTAELRRDKLVLDYWRYYTIPITNPLNGQQHEVCMSSFSLTKIKEIGYDTDYIEVGTHKHLYASLRTQLSELPRSASIRIWYSDHKGNHTTVPSSHASVIPLIGTKLFFCRSWNPPKESAEKESGDEAVLRFVSRERIL